MTGWGYFILRSYKKVQHALNSVGGSFKPKVVGGCEGSTRCLYSTTLMICVQWEVVV